MHTYLSLYTFSPSYMEHHMMSFLPFLLSSTIFIIFLAQIVKVVKGLRVRSKTHNLPPGPWKLPIIGSLHHFIGYLPHHRLRQLAKIYGPLMHIQLGEASTIVVSSPEVAHEVLKTHDSIFAQRPHQIGADIICYGSTDIATAPYGGYWKQLRRICSQELLCPKRVRSFQSIREEEVSNLIKYISTNIGSPVNLSDKVSGMLSYITSRATFGVICKVDHLKFVTLIKKLVTMSETLFILDLFPSHKWLHILSGMQSKMEEIHKIFDTIFEKIIKEAAITKTDETKIEGLLSVLLSLNDRESLEYPLTIDNIKAVILDMFAGGTSTIFGVIEWAMSEMLKNPRVMTRAQEEVREVFGRNGYNGNETTLQELKYLKAVIKETLRLHPPLPLLLPRECRETCEIKGYTIPAGNKVVVNVWAMGRDPKYWSEPDMFLPERFLDCSIDYIGSNLEYIPFGAGRRMCPAILYGLSNAELCLSQLLYHYNWEFPIGTNKENFEMIESMNSTSRRKTNLILVPVTYNPVLVSQP